MTKRVLITGGAGYVGSALVPYLLERGYQVVVYDTMWFGDGGPPHAYLHKELGDIREASHFGAICEAHKIEAVIHLAAIANDPSFELNPSLSKEINFSCFEPLVMAAKDAGVKRFIYASSSSVYGISTAPEVTEDHPLLPVTDYNRFKGACEPILLRHQHPEFTTVVVRPATICGYGSRQRLDVVVNMFTAMAVVDGVIRVYGGEQQRPNLHIDDMCAAYDLMLRAPADRIAGETFNVGHENMKVRAIAEAVKQVVPQEISARMQGVEIKIDRTVMDNRSYVISSKKLAAQLGWRARRTVFDAINDLCDAFRTERLPLALEDRFFNVRHMKAIGLA